jgi:drug/metabolite transporter (DMT)-like permease
VTASLNIALAIFLWSSLGVIVRLSGVPVHLLIFYSCAVAVAVQGAALRLTGRRKELPRATLWKYPVILGGMGLLNTFSYYYAFQHTTIANAVLTHYTAPVIVAFAAPVFLKEKTTKVAVVALAVASGGLWIMLRGVSLADGHAAGLVGGLISGFAYAAIIISARIFTQGLTPLALTFYSNVVIAVMLLPFVKEFPVGALWIFVIMGVVHSTVAPILYYRGLRYVTANRAAILGYLEPVSAILFSMVFLNEVPGPASIAGGILILLSGYLALRGGVPDAEIA